MNVFYMLTAPVVRKLFWSVTCANKCNLVNMCKEYFLRFNKISDTLVSKLQFNKQYNKLHIPRESFVFLKFQNSLLSFKIHLVCSSKVVSLQLTPKIGLK